MERLNKLKSKDRIANPGKMQAPQFGTMRLNIHRQTVEGADTNESVHLTGKEYQLLWLVTRAQGGVVSDGEIVAFLYEDLPDNQNIPLGNTAQVLIYRIQKKLAKATGGKVEIGNKHGLGYFLQINE